MKTIFKHSMKILQVILMLTVISISGILGVTESKAKNFNHPESERIGVQPTRYFLFYPGLNVGDDSIDYEKLSHNTNLYRQLDYGQDSKSNVPKELKKDWFVDSLGHDCVKSETALKQVSYKTNKSGKHGTNYDTITKAMNEEAKKKRLIGVGNEMKLEAYNEAQVKLYRLVREETLHVDMVLTDKNGNIITPYPDMEMLFRFKSDTSGKTFPKEPTSKNHKAKAGHKCTINLPYKETGEFLDKEAGGYWTFDRWEYQNKIIGHKTTESVKLIPEENKPDIIGYWKFTPVKMDYTIEYYTQDIDNNDYTKETVTDPINMSTEITFGKDKKTAKLKPGYQYVRTEFAGNNYPDVDKDERFLITTSQNVIKVYYDRDESQKLKYTVEYYKVGENNPFDSASKEIWAGNPQLSSVDTVTYKPAGFKFKNTEPNLPTRITATNNVIKVYYEKDESQRLKYTVEYYKVGESNPFDTVNKEIWAGDSQVSSVDTETYKPAGFKFKNTEPNLPTSITATNNVIKVYYKNNIQTLTIQKIWDVDTSKHRIPESVNLVISRKTGESVDNTYSKTITVTKAKNWTDTIEEVEIQPQDEDKNYQYVITEEKIQGFKPTEQNVIAESTNNGLIAKITNQADQASYASLEIVNISEDNVPLTGSFKLEKGDFQNNNFVPSTTVRNITLPSSGKYNISLAEGIYKVAQTKAQAGYVFDADTGYYMKVKSEDSALTMTGLNAQGQEIAGVITSLGGGKYELKIMNTKILSNTVYNKGSDGPVINGSLFNLYKKIGNSTDTQQGFHYPIQITVDNSAIGEEFFEVRAQLLKQGANNILAEKKLGSDTSLSDTFEASEQGEYKVVFKFDDSFKGTVDVNENNVVLKLELSNLKQLEEELAIAQAELAQLPQTATQAEQSQSENTNKSSETVITDGETPLASPNTSSTADTTNTTGTSSTADTTNTTDISNTDSQAQPENSAQDTDSDNPSAVKQEGSAESGTVVMQPSYSSIGTPENLTDKKKELEEKIKELTAKIEALRTELAKDVEALIRISGETDGYRLIGSYTSGSGVGIQPGQILPKLSEEGEYYLMQTYAPGGANGVYQYYPDVKYRFRIDKTGRFSLPAEDNRIKPETSGTGETFYFIINDLIKDQPPSSNPGTDPNPYIPPIIIDPFPNNPSNHIINEDSTPLAKPSDSQIDDEEEEDIILEDEELEDDEVPLSDDFKLDDDKVPLAHVPKTSDNILRTSGFYAMVIIAIGTRVLFSKRFKKK